MITKRKIGKYITETSGEIKKGIIKLDVPDDVMAKDNSDLMFYCGQLFGLINLGIHFGLYSDKQLKEMNEMFVKLKNESES